MLFNMNVSTKSHPFHTRFSNLKTSPCKTFPKNLNDNSEPWSLGSKSQLQQLLLTLLGADGNLDSTDNLIQDEMFLFG